MRPLSFRPGASPGFGDADRLGPHHQHRTVGRAGRARLEEVRLADEVRDEARRRPVVDLARHADLLDPSFVHHGDAVAIDIASSWSCVT
jgi:hypothetical protein